MAEQSSKGTAMKNIACVRLANPSLLVGAALVLLCDRAASAAQATNTVAAPSLLARPSPFARWTTNYSLATNGATTGPQPTSNQRTVRQPENAGPHHLSWSVSADAGNAGATNKAVGGRIVAMASGMNYWDG